MNFLGLLNERAFHDIPSNLKKLPSKNEWNTHSLIQNTNANAMINGELPYACMR